MYSNIYNIDKIAHFTLAEKRRAAEQQRLAKLARKSRERDQTEQAPARRRPGWIQWLASRLVRARSSAVAG